MPADAKARTTVVVATRDRRASLTRTLARLLSLPEWPPVVVADNASSDGTAELVLRAFPTVTLVRLERNAGAAARTRAAEAIATPYVAFSDDDSWWEPGGLARAERLLAEHPRLGLVAARVLVGDDRRDDPANEAMRESPLPRGSLPGPPVLGFLACGAVVRRRAFLEAGGFWAPGIGAEESLLAVDLARRGWSLVYAEDVVAHHHPSPVRDAATRRRSDARNALLFAWLRRPVAIALAQTAATLRDGLLDGATLRGVADVAAAAPRVARERDVVPPSLETALRRLGL